MERAKSSAIPILLIVVFSIAFAAGIKNLNSRGGSSDARSGVLNFMGDTDSAFAAASKEGKIVMVKYGAEWCGPCRAMEKDAFVSQRIAEILKDVIVVDIDIDSPGTDSDWVRDHNVGPIPTVQFFRSDRSKIGETVGYGGVDGFASELEKLLAKA